MSIENIDDVVTRILACYAQRIKYKPSLTYAVRPMSQPTAEAIKAELEALNIAFDNTLEFDAKENYLCVTSKDVILEDVNLGPFKIKLIVLNAFTHGLSADVGEYWGERAFTITALKPKLSKVHNVDHPHRHSAGLCTGRGRKSLTVAFEEGSLTDAFLIFNSVLNDYNPEDRYGHISNWKDLICHNCADIIAGTNYIKCPTCTRISCLKCLVVCKNPRCRFQSCKICNKVALNPHDEEDKTTYCLRCVHLAPKPPPKVKLLDGREIRLFGAYDGPEVSRPGMFPVFNSRSEYMDEEELIG